MSLRFEWRGPFAFATLDRAEARNALTDEMVRALHTAVAEVAARPDARALVIRGSGGHFCAGGDFAAFKSLIARPAPATGPDPIATMNRAFGTVLQALATLEVPSVAAVDGAAMGGGVGLAAACDIVIAASTARFGTPEVTLGLPPAQIAAFLAARVGDHRAKRLMFGGDAISAEAALALGLVDEVADDVGFAVQTRLSALGRAEPAALRATKRLLALRAPASLDAVLDAAAHEFAQALRSGTALEGMAAFAQKRAPSWAYGPQPPVPPFTQDPR